MGSRSQGLGFWALGSPRRNSRKGSMKTTVLPGGLLRVLEFHVSLMKTISLGIQGQGVMSGSLYAAVLLAPRSSEPSPPPLEPSVEKKSSRKRLITSVPMNFP